MHSIGRVEKCKNPQGSFSSAAHRRESLCILDRGYEMIPELDGPKHTYAHTLTYIPSPARPRSNSSWGSQTVGADGESSGFFYSTLARS